MESIAVLAEQIAVRRLDVMAPRKARARFNSNPTGAFRNLSFNRYEAPGREFGIAG